MAAVAAIGGLVMLGAASCGTEQATTSTAATSPTRGTCQWHKTQAAAIFVDPPLHPLATSPAGALQEALTDGDVPDPSLRGQWIRITSKGTRAVSYFRGVGTRPDGQPAPGAIVRGDVVAFAPAPAPHRGWMFVTNVFEDCDPNASAAVLAGQQLPRGGAAYLLSFPGRSDSTDIADECLGDAPVTDDSTDGKTDFRLEHAPTPRQWRVVLDCIAFHHGVMKPATLANPNDYGFVHDVRFFDGNDVAGLSDSQLLSAGREICKARKHPATPVPVPEIAETITVTSDASGGFSWTFSPETASYFNLVTSATDDQYCK